MDTNLIAFETLIAAQETAKWTYWIMFATWFSGAATFSAVVLTLYIANRKPVPSLKISASGSIISPSPGITQQGYGITVANIGNSPAVISSIHWECGGKQKFVQFFDPSVSSPMPKKLEHGESAFFFLELDDFSAWVRSMKTNIDNAEGSVDKLKIVVTLSTGRIVKCKAETSLRRDIKTITS
ncbi:hypothetical protein MW376_000255 [Citrobacter freundii]|nr:hypothetical protein [Citrobacter freundii]EJB8558165.1 hypothetical protein [Citrobacter freundii]